MDTGRHESLRASHGDTYAHHSEYYPCTCTWNINNGYSRKDQKELTNGGNDRLLDDILAVGIRCIKYDEEEHFEDVYHGALHYYPNDRDEGRRRCEGFDVSCGVVLVPDSICNQAGSHEVLGKCERVYCVHPVNKPGRKHGAFLTLSESVERDTVSDWAKLDILQGFR